MAEIMAIGALACACVAVDVVSPSDHFPAEKNTGKVGESLQCRILCEVYDVVALAIVFRLLYCHLTRSCGDYTTIGHFSYLLVD